MRSARGRFTIIFLLYECLMVVVECWPFTREISDNRRRKCLQIPDYYRKCSYDAHTRIVYIYKGWIPRRVVSAYDVVNASYLPTTINIYDLEIRSINNYRKSYDIASFLVSTNISRRCRFGNSKPCKYIRSSYVRRNCIYDNNRVSANISSYDYR